MLPITMRFSRSPGEFGLTIIACPTLDCPCTEVCFGLREIGKNGAKHVIRVDVPSWQEANAPERPAAVSEIVGELLRDFPESERSKLREMFADKRTISEYLNACCLPPATGVNGEHVYFDEIVAGAGTFIVDGPLAISWRFEWQERQFIAMDSYCVNPACDCKHAYLHIFDATPMPSAESEPPAREELLAATISLDGTIEINHHDGCSAAQARLLPMVWKERCIGALDQIRWRYAKMKEIGRRSGIGKSPAAALPEPRTFPRLHAAGVAGRNDPCPCGSGLKYKKCCGR